jgi:CubicO group peptidase (beta-lactamase class C family)
MRLLGERAGVILLHRFQNFQLGKLLLLVFVLYAGDVYSQSNKKNPNYKSKKVKIIESQSSLERNLSNLITDSVKDGTIQAGYILVFKDGQLSLEMGEVFQRNSLISVASITKPFSAFCILKLVESGVFKLSDPISRYISDLHEYKDMKGGEEITIRDLLQHTSGIPYEGNSTMVKIHVGTKSINIPNQVDIAGKRFIYSNYNYRLLASLVEEATGQSLADYLKEVLLDPLEIWDYDLSQFDGASGLLISPDGLSRFAKMILAKGNWQDKQLLSYSKWKYFTKRPRKSTSKVPNYYGIGWTIQKKKKKVEIMMHIGRSETSYSVLKIYPEEKIISMYFVTNSKKNPKKFEALHKTLESRIEKYISQSIKLEQSE